MTINEQLDAQRRVINRYKSKASWRDPKWHYVCSTQTDLRATFARVRREMKKQEQK